MEYFSFNANSVICNETIFIAKQIISILYKIVQRLDRLGDNVGKTETAFVIP